MQNNVIIVAGGKGLRMGADLPKQFITVCGKPLLMYTLESFYSFDEKINIVLVLPQSHQNYWQELCIQYKFEVPHALATGGETRFHSVQNGLQLVKEGLVGVHDGVRPFATAELISKCYALAKSLHAVIPVIDSTDSLREIEDGGKSHIIDRSKIKLVQTPQVFDYVLLKEVYGQEYNAIFTDDASVVEAMGYRVHLVEGERDNIKVTTPIDLKIAELIINS